MHKLHELSWSSTSEFTAMARPFHNQTTMLFVRIAIYRMITAALNFVACLCVCVCVWSRLCFYAWIVNIKCKWKNWSWVFFFSRREWSEFCPFIAINHHPVKRLQKVIVMQSITFECVLHFLQEVRTTTNVLSLWLPLWS